MEQFYKLTGKLVYEPARQDLKKTFKAKTLIVDLPFDDLANFYLWQIKRKYLVHLHPPMWGNHVTVVRGDEKIPHPEHWKKYEGEEVEFEVMPHLYKVWDFWALPVRSPRLYGIRAELGLKVFHEMHITVGRETDHDRKVWNKKQLKMLSQRPVFIPEARGQNTEMNPPMIEERIAPSLHELDKIGPNGRRILKLKR